MDCNHRLAEVRQNIDLRRPDNRPCSHKDDTGRHIFAALTDMLPHFDRFKQRYLQLTIVGFLNRHNSITPDRSRCSGHDPHGTPRFNLDSVSTGSGRKVAGHFQPAGNPATVTAPYRITVHGRIIPERHIPGCSHIKSQYPANSIQQTYLFDSGRSDVFQNELPSLFK